MNSLEPDGLTIYGKTKLGKSPIFSEANEDALRLIKIYLRQFLSTKHIIQ